MIEEITLTYDVDDPHADKWITLAVAVNALIRKMNVMEKMVDRKYATNDHAKVLRENVDPNVRE